VANVAEDVAAAVASDVEYRLREVIQDAAKFMHHSKRQRMTADDINRALRVRNVEPLFGFTSREALRYRKVPGSGVADVYYLEDEELDLNEIINAALPRIPLDVSFTSHWLAIEGVQPAIPQNPPPLCNANNKSTFFMFTKKICFVFSCFVAEQGEADKSTSVPQTSLATGKIEGFALTGGGAQVTASLLFFFPSLCLPPRANFFFFSEKNSPW